MVAFTYRMGAGFAGTVSRTHPASIAPYLKDATNPPTFFGQPVIVNTSANTVRAVLDSDRSGGATNVFGVVCRPYPFQGVTAPTNNYAGTGTTWGTSQLPDGAVDILLSGFILVATQGTPTLGGSVYIWTAAASGNHITGGWEATNPSGNGFGVSWGMSTLFNSPVDSNGVAELKFNA